MKTLRNLSISAFLLLIYACSHPIEIVGEGDVTSASGNRGCSFEDSIAVPIAKNCAENLVAGAYQETYYATPRSGWQFDHWGNYCAEATPPNYDCSFNISAATVMKYWGQTMPPLQAVFTPIESVDTDGDGLNDDVDPCPQNPTNPCAAITAADIVTVGSREWAQPDIFINPTWNTITAVCPEGVCRNSATLNGFDLSGWTWANLVDVSELIDVYIAPDTMGGDPGFKILLESSAFDAFFAEVGGFRPLISGTPVPGFPVKQLYAVTSTLADPASAYYLEAHADYQGIFYFATEYTRTLGQIGGPITSALFYRD